MPFSSAKVIKEAKGWKRFPLSSTFHLLSRLYLSLSLIFSFSFCLLFPSPSLLSCPCFVCFPLKRHPAYRISAVTAYGLKQQMQTWHGCQGGQTDSTTRFFRSLIFEERLHLKQSSWTAHRSTDTDRLRWISAKVEALQAAGRMLPCTCGSQLVLQFQTLSVWKVLLS